MIKVASLGMPRFGKNADLPKFIRENILKHNTDPDYNELEAIGQKVRNDNWKLQVNEGIDIIPCNDFSFYDHVLDNSVLLGNIPRRYYWEGGVMPFSIYFAMVFGQKLEKFDIQPMQKSYWYDTTYKYVVPELSDPIDFVYSDNKAVLHFLEAKKSFSCKTRPSLMGIVSYLQVAQVEEDDKEEISDKSKLTQEAISVYHDLFENFVRLGISDVEFYEPCFAQDLSNKEQDRFVEFYGSLVDEFKDQISIHLTSYGDAEKYFDCIDEVGFASVHIDCLQTLNWKNVIGKFQPETSVSLGFIDAKSMYISDLSHIIAEVKDAIKIIGSDRVIVAPTSSLFLTGHSVRYEKTLPKDLLGLVAFAHEKIRELSVIKKAINEGEEFVAEELSVNAANIVRLKSLAEKLQNAWSQDVATDQGRVSFHDRSKVLSINEGDPVLEKIMFGSVVSGFPNKKNKKHINTVVKIQESSNYDVISSCDVERGGCCYEYFAHMYDGLFVSVKNYIPKSGHEFGMPIFPYDNIVANEEFANLENIAKILNTATKKPKKMSLLGAISVSNVIEVPLESLRETLFLKYSKELQRQIEVLQENSILHIAIKEDFLLKNIILDSEGLTLNSHSLANKFKLATSTAWAKSKIYLEISGYYVANIIEVLTDCDADGLFISQPLNKNAIVESLMSYRYKYLLGLGVFTASSNISISKADVGNQLKYILRPLEESQVIVSPDGVFDGDNDRMEETLAAIDEVVEDFKSKL